MIRRSENNPHKIKMIKGLHFIAKARVALVCDIYCVRIKL